MTREIIEAMKSEHDFFVSMDMLVCELEHLGIRCGLPFVFTWIPYEQYELREEV